MNNVAFTYGPKQKDPFTGEGNNKYLVPKVKDQQGKQFNYVCVTCTPSMNGVYKYPAANIEHYVRWNNRNSKCLYVPIDDCEFCAFEDLPHSMVKADLLAGVKQQQIKGFKGEVANNPKSYPHGMPDWMLSSPNHDGKDGR